MQSFSHNKTGGAAEFLRRYFTRFVLKYAGWIAVAGTCLAIVGGYYSVRLFGNLRTDFQELLPTDARSVTDLGEVTRRLQSIDSLAILIFSRDTRASKRLVIDLANRLNALPGDVASSVEFQISKELRFFKRRQALYMDAEDLKRIRDYVRDRIDYEKELYNPLNIFRTENLPEPSLDYSGLGRKYHATLSTYDRFPGGFYATPDETKRVILVYMSGQAASIDKDLELRRAVQNAIAELNPKSYAPDMRIQFTSGVEDTIEEHDALVEDLEISTVIVMVLVTVAMLLFYRNIRATLALVWSLLVGTLWTFGVSYFVVGYLNANSAFLGSIVLGNGINFGIILLARYLEERRKGRNNARAQKVALTHTATSTWTAALAAALSYGSLILTGFRGFRQFGIIGLIGMVLCWISAFLMMPAYLTLLDKIFPIVKREGKAPRPVFAGALAWLIDRFTPLVWGISVLLTVLSAATFARYSSGILETDLSRLRNKRSMEQGSGYLARYLDEIFQRYLTPMVILPRTRKQALEIEALLKKKKAEQGTRSLIASVQTLDDFVPTRQSEKIKLIKEIRAELSPKIFYRLPEKDQKEALEFLTPEATKPIAYNDLPPLLLTKFTEKDGSIGKMVLVEPVIGTATWQGDRLASFIRDLREAADSVSPNTPVAGSLTITADMIEAISRDGPRATLFAFLAVVLLVILEFRNLRIIALTLFALIMGVIWLAGFILGFWVKINFLNFIALPITFGIGVDYGVNMFQRFRQEGGGNILKVVRNTGGAVALCSFTTIVGYCSLLLAGNRAFVSFGLLAVAGEITCVTAAVVSLPAYLLMRYRRKMRSPGEMTVNPGSVLEPRIEDLSSD